jgi:AraC-like DNA-binding protein
MPLYLPKNTMILHLKYDFHVACRRIVEEQLSQMDLDFTMNSFSELVVKTELSPELLQSLHHQLHRYGIEVVESSKSILVQKIKDCIIGMVYLEDKLPTVKISAHLASQLHHSYGYLSNLFSEVTYTSIENFIILQKIERAKQLITTKGLTFTEIAWQLNYSSLAHFCTQFKNATGLTPTSFQRIIQKRRENNADEAAAN